MQFSKIVLAFAFALGVMSMPTANIEALGVREPEPHLTDANVVLGCERDADVYYDTGC
ncbi:uncharacterized protein K444DRAFT_616255 [Hyaloscypha bicolor E]|uniref:Uncharacterized protein n=1 Tax=Hyaloscypha bicolor E TaxID=1095630 RepID=A0A2J6T0G7_9HELO|nr:uncharacterized protein K444DRAFT_616255 [Hyaloscypha bicolor E]PMD56423.1 hypothetical protein K444DRAFT_616255 [Hyaloscypha bicolor E]